MLQVAKRWGTDIDVNINTVVSLEVFTTFLVKVEALLYDAISVGTYLTLCMSLLPHLHGRAGRLDHTLLR